MDDREHAHGGAWMLTVLRTAFLAYVRVLLCLQGLGLGLLALVLWPVRNPRAPFWLLIVLALFVAFLGLAVIAVAFLLRRGRYRAALAAIVIEALYAAAAAALGLKILKDWPFDWRSFQEVALGAALFLVAVAGLLLRSVRAYTGLVRR